MPLLCFRFDARRYATPRLRLIYFSSLFVGRLSHLLYAAVAYVQEWVQAHTNKGEGNKIPLMSYLVLLHCGTNNAQCRATFTILSFILCPYDVISCILCRFITYHAAAAIAFTPFA